MNTHQATHPNAGGVTEPVLAAVRLRMSGHPWRKAAKLAGVSLSQLQRKYPSVSAAITEGRELKIITIERRKVCA